MLSSSTSAYCTILIAEKFVCIAAYTSLRFDKVYTCCISAVINGSALISSFIRFSCVDKSHFARKSSLVAAERYSVSAGMGKGTNSTRPFQNTSTDATVERISFSSLSSFGRDMEDGDVDERDAPPRLLSLVMSTSRSNDSTSMSSVLVLASATSPITASDFSLSLSSSSRPPPPPRWSHSLAPELRRAVKTTAHRFYCLFSWRRSWCERLGG
mmetsp:Transcript_91288/g.182034  ORF Transcript_91288/g.182034 Transcript_91288/m.182034 type:complete len:213 (+) Transcript_91288:1268-1906(+)